MGFISICLVEQQMTTITPNFQFKCGYNLIHALVEIVENICGLLILEWLNYSKLEFEGLKMPNCI